MSETYSFRGRLSAEFPSQVIIDTTELCNLACVHCPHPQFKESTHYSATSLSPELNAKAIDEVRVHGAGHTQYVRYTGSGETMIHKQFFDMLAYATANSGGVPVTVTSNGTLLNPLRIERLLAARPDVIDISIDAHQAETYSAIRVNGNLAVTRANVIDLITRNRQLQQRSKIVVSYIEQPRNRGETAEFERFWKDQGADYVVIRRLHSAAGAVTGVADEMRQSNAAIPRRPCVYPWERVVLNPRGHLAFCPADWTHGSTVLDYRTTTIKETWHGEFYSKLRAAHLSNDFSQHSFCGQCPDWKETRWPHEGRAYADMVEEFTERE
jgi:pyruvate-formate lyase-activating enzyme